ncbi:MAG: M23 family metallopeptidase [Candidatus Sericytochromatia bacterium]|nr:M23 family metallopeptidase [Candidatus Sericytochromatia bacterium]
MKLKFKWFLPALLVSLHGFQPMQAWAESDTFLKLVRDPSAQRTFTNRVVQEVKSWSSQQSPVNAVQLSDTRLAFNLSPRHPVLRQKLAEMLKAQIRTEGHPQDLELAYNRLLNLAPRDEKLRLQLSQLLYRKHGKASVEQIKRSHTLLNDAFNRWDEQKYDLSLGYFKEAALPGSSEFNTLLAMHLRDRGRVAEAQAQLKAMTGQPDYLFMRAGLAERMNQAEKILLGEPAPEAKIGAQIELGQYTEAEAIWKKLPQSAMKHWWRAKFLEKQARYHEAAVEYQGYYRLKWEKQFPDLVPVVYKVQLEDINSLDLVALKFRTSSELLKQVNEGLNQDWLETYRMVVVPMPRHGFSWPTVGYVSSHFGYRLHPIRATWRLHEGIDIETFEGIPASAAIPGRVVQRGYDKECGNMVRLQHEPQLQTVYCHGEKLLVSQSQSVARSQALMITGNTGASASNHLHFGVRLQGQYTDPMDWL